MHSSVFVCSCKLYRKMGCFSTWRQYIMLGLWADTNKRSAIDSIVVWWHDIDIQRLWFNNWCWGLLSLLLWCLLLFVDVLMLVVVCWCIDVCCCLFVGCCYIDVCCCLFVVVTLMFVVVCWCWFVVVVLMLCDVDVTVAVVWFSVDVDVCCCYLMLLYGICLIMVCDDVGVVLMLDGYCWPCMFYVDVWRCWLLIYCECIWVL